MLQAFILTFLAEWGDRSQVATIAVRPRKRGRGESVMVAPFSPGACVCVRARVQLATHKNPIGVTVGGCLGHALCTGASCLLDSARRDGAADQRWHPTHETPCRGEMVVEAMRCCVPACGRTLRNSGAAEHLTHGGRRKTLLSDLNGRDMVGLQDWQFWGGG